MAGATLADCATDDLAGWQERAHGQTKQHPGILQSFNLTKPAIEQLILNARIKAGWIEPPAPEEEPVELGEGGVEAGELEESGAEAGLAGPEEGAGHAEPEEKAL